MIIFMHTRSIFHFHVFVNVFCVVDIIPGACRLRLALCLPRPGPVVVGGHGEGDHQGESGAEHHPGRHVQCPDQESLDKMFQLNLSHLFLNFSNIYLFLGFVV